MRNEVKVGTRFLSCICNACYLIFVFAELLLKMRTMASKNDGEESGHYKEKVSSYASSRSLTISIEFYLYYAYTGLSSSRKLIVTI